MFGPPSLTSLMRFVANGWSLDARHSCRDYASSQTWSNMERKSCQKIQLSENHYDLGDCLNFLETRRWMFLFTVFFFIIGIHGTQEMNPGYVGFVCYTWSIVSNIWAMILAFSTKQTTASDPLHSFDWLHFCVMFQIGFKHQALNDNFPDWSETSHLLMFVREWMHEYISKSSLVHSVPVVKPHLHISLHYSKHNL